MAAPGKDPVLHLVEHLPRRHRAGLEIIQRNPRRLQQLEVESVGKARRHVDVELLPLDIVERRNPAILAHEDVVRHHAEDEQEPQVLEILRHGRVGKGTLLVIGKAQVDQRVQREIHLVGQHEAKVVLVPARRLDREAVVFLRLVGDIRHQRPVHIGPRPRRAGADRHLLLRLRGNAQHRGRGDGRGKGGHAFHDHVRSPLLDFWFHGSRFLAGVSGQAGTQGFPRRRRTRRRRSGFRD